MVDARFRLPLASRRAVLAGLGASAVAPLARAAMATPMVETIALAMPDGRTLSIELLQAPGRGKRDAIFFSHGANSAPDRYRELTAYWAARGFLVVSPLHLDSELHPARETRNQSRVLRTRIADMDAIRRGLTQRTLLPPAIGARLRGGAPIAAGHSFGAYIAQIMGGATVLDPAGGALLAAEGPGSVGAIVALSPPPSAPGFSPPRSWATITAPMLVQTGTADVMPPFVARWQQHLDSYRAAPAAQAWGAVYEGVDHYFNGVICRPRPDAEPRAQAQLRRFAELSLAFVDFARAGPGGDAAFARRFATLCDRPLSPGTPIEA